MPRTKGVLTAQQRKFIAAYVADPGSATRAAIKAGCSPKSARHQGSQWRNAPEYQHVQDALEMALADRLIDAQSTRRMCFLALKRIIENPVPAEKLRRVVAEGKNIDEELEPEELRLISGMTLSKFQDEGVTLSVKGWPLIQAIAQMLKHFGHDDGIELEDKRQAEVFDRKLDAIEARLAADAAAELGGDTEPEPE